MLRLPVPPIAKSRGFFTRDEALAAGWSARAIRTQLSNGVWRQLAQGRYVETCIFNALSPEGRHRLIALATAFERNIVLLRDTAACVYGLAVARTPRIVAARHPSEVDECDLVTIHGVRLLSEPRTVVDCARVLGPREGLVVADSALRQRRTSRAQLAEQVSHLPANSKGIAAAHFVVAEADERAETPI